MNNPPNQRRQLQVRAFTLIYTKGRLKKELLDLQRYKHHLTGHDMDDRDRPARDSEIEDKKKRLETINTDLETTNARIKALGKNTGS